MNIDQTTTKLKNSYIVSTYASSAFGAVIGVIVSIAAALFVHIVRYFNDQNHFSDIKALSYGPITVNLTTVILIACAAVAILVLRRLFNVNRWHGPADTIYAAHQDLEPIDLKMGLASTLAALVSACGSASVGQYGPLVHFGATLGLALKQTLFVPMRSNVVIGCGVAAAISAGFDAPIAGIIFAHEAILRHFSARAMAPIATSAIVAAAMVNYVFQLPNPLSLRSEAPPLLEALLPVILSAVIFGFVAILFMQSLRFFMSLNKRLALPAYKSLFIASLCVVLVGAYIPETLGLGTQTLGELLNVPPTLGLALALFAGKIFLTSICLGFGFFGGVFSPALFVGASAGAVLGSAFVSTSQGDLSTALTLAGMASVAACVVGAPLATVFIVLELTLSYEFTLITLLAVVVSQVVSSNIFGHSFFDRQLIDRGIDLRQGRSQLLLTQTKIGAYATSDFVASRSEQSVKQLLDALRRKIHTEAYFVSDSGLFVGKLTINQLLTAPPDAAVDDLVDHAPLLLEANTSLQQSIEKASSFVGESIPVVSSETGHLLGVVTEADLFSAYLEIQETIRDVER